MDEIKELVDEYERLSDSITEKKKTIDRMIHGVRERVYRKYETLLKILPKDYYFDEYFINGVRILISRSTIYYGNMEITELSLDALIDLYLHYGDIVNVIEKDLRGLIEDKREILQKEQKNIEKLYKLLDTFE